MRAIENESDLDDAYIEWLNYKPLGEGRQHIRFGQYVYNEYDLEYKNSYNESSDLKAYNLLSEYLYQKHYQNTCKIEKIKSIMLNNLGREYRRCGFSDFNNMKDALKEIDEVLYEIKP